MCKSISERSTSSNIVEKLSAIPKLIPGSEKQESFSRARAAATGNTFLSRSPFSYSRFHIRDIRFHGFELLPDKSGGSCMSQLS